LKFKTPENKLKSSRAWKAKNKERIKEYRKQYWLENQERERQTNAEWLKNNEEEWKQKKREFENINKSARLDWVRSPEPQLVPCVT